MSAPPPLDLDAFQAGDEALFARLVRCYSPRLLPYLRRYAADSAEADDLLQEVWLRAYRKRQTYSGRGSFLGWLLTVCRTVGLAAAGGRRPEHPAEALDDVANPQPTGDAELRQTLQEAVLSLPERQRDVVLLRLVEGRSTAEAARLLGCAEGTVKATLHQAIGKLQKLLEETAL